LDEEISTRLVDLNRQFYQTFAVQFAATRWRIQPGVQQVLNTLPLDADILDVGCGNGELARQLARRGYQGNYMGLDFSSNLLSDASESLPGNFTFRQADLSAAGWGEPLKGRKIAFVLAFAVFHHLPSQGLRRRVLTELHSHMPVGGRLIHSEWQFLNSPRLQTRLQPWEKAGLSASQVDEGDYLLDWRAGGSGLRYVHLFTEAELDDLAQAGGFQVLETFYSDGQRGNLGLYQVWEKSSI
jgi:tRNA (uracil-5-)-methyltransferase TRM9